MEIDEEDSNENKDVTAESILSTTSFPSRTGEYPQQHQVQIVANGLEIHGLNNLQIQEPQITPIPIPTPTLSNGVSIGIQSDRVIELALYTRLISTSSVKHSILNHAAWNGPSAYTSTPETALLAIGGKAIGQIWEVNRLELPDDELGASSNSSTDHHYPRKVIHPQTIIDLAVGPTQILVSLAWSPDSMRLAYSTFSDDIEGAQRSVIRTRSRLPDSGDETYSTVPDAVTNLTWNDTGRYLAGLSSTSLIILDTKTATQLQPLDIEHTLFDAAWLGSETLVICGDSTITIASISGGSISISHAFNELAGSTEWTKLRYNKTLNSFAIASEVFGDLVLDGQAVAVPAGDVGGVVALEREVAGDEVLEHLVEEVPHVDVAVGVRRAVVQDEFRAVCGGGADLLVQLVFLPFRDPAGFAFRQVAAHRKRRVRHVDRVTALRTGFTTGTTLGAIRAFRLAGRGRMGRGRLRRLLVVLGHGCSVLQ